jgi:2-keto-4-pentenoate hydratase
VQDAAIASWGKQVVGWKVGRVVPPLPDRIRHRPAGRPDFRRPGGGAADGDPVMPVFADGFVAGEAEFLLHVGAPPPAGQTQFTLAEAPV